MYAYQVKECTWSFAGGGRQPLVPALVRVVEEEGAGGQSKAPSGFRGRQARHEGIGLANTPLQSCISLND